MAAPQTGSVRCLRAQSECEYHSIDSIKSISVGVVISERAGGVLARRGTSGRSVPSKGGVGAAAPVVGRIGTVGTGSMEGREETLKARWSEADAACAPWGVVVGRWGK